MEEAFETIALEPSDMDAYTVDDVVCTNCIKGFCPARTPASYGGGAFTFCGARKLCDGVLAAYQQRTGRVLHIEKPC